MKTITRRDFIRKSTVTVGAALLACQKAIQAHAGPLKIPVGVQTYVVRDMIGKDFEGTLRKLAAMGYKSIEMCSPPGYVSSGFGPLTKLKASEMREIIHSAGLRCESSHYSFGELREKLDERIAYARELGLTQMIASGFWLKKDASLTDWLKAAEELNKMGERTKKEGIQLGFHNHHFEFTKIDGTLVYDALMDKLDPELIKMQFQVAVISIGYKAVTYLKKYPGRFISLHLADWSETEKKSVPIGQGIVDWKELFAAAKAAGVKNYFVEMGLDLLESSSVYLNNLKV
ncbi:MAG: TIM barrel protein [Kiritimatiellae bacterium]|nr:TIM barrel protein [Kiritimatiellia bacterium]MDD5522458.1 TIM barrel protein [Kiritimatiellia bacterium]